MIPQCKKTAYCKAIMSSDYTITADSTVEILPLGKFVLNKGNFTLTDDGGIKIGAGINAVRVDISVYFYSPLTLNQDKIIYIYKNKSNQCTKNTYIVNTYDHASTSTIISVTEGDVIYLKVKGSANDVIKSYESGTFLCMQNID